MNWPSNRVARAFASASLALLVGLSFSSHQAFAENESSNTTLAEVESLLVQARQAMAAQDFERAESLLQRAEKADVSYPVLHFGDKPARVRNDLERMRSLGNSKPGKSSPQTVTNQFVENKPAQNSPLGDRYSNTQAAAVAAPDLISADGALQQAKSHLLAARRALVVGDTVQATKHAELAKQTGAVFAPSADSPRRVEHAIQERTQLETTKDNSPTWRHSYAKFLVAQAGMLLEHGDLDRAEQISHEAAGMRVAFEIADTTPEDVLSRVARVRKSTASVPGAMPLPKK